MTLSNFPFTETNHFVAMEYYRFILNRTYVVLITKNEIVGIQGNGLIAVQGGKDLATQYFTSKLAIDGNLYNPFVYLKSSYLKKVDDIEITSEALITTNPTNFIIPRYELDKATYNPDKKFGMGPYPYDGRVTIFLKSGRKREFIILGNQSGNDIAKWLTT